MEITIIVICLLLSAFFSGMEIAYVSSNKVYLSIERDNKTLMHLFLNFKNLPRNHLSLLPSMLVGNNVVLVIYGIYSVI